MTMETERIRNRCTWRDNNVTISAYVPKEVYDRLIQLANERTQARGKWMSISQLVREIITETVEPDK